MRNLTTTELFQIAETRFKENNFREAEQYFLAAMHVYAITKDSYMHLLGSIDKLALHIYPKGEFEGQDRVRYFYETFSKIDRNASAGYAMTIYNGHFGEIDYSLLLKQLSKANQDDQNFILGNLYIEGKAFKKDDEKAAILLSCLEDNKWRSKAKDLVNSLKIELDFSQDELLNQMAIIRNKSFEGNTLELEDGVTLEDMLSQFFEDENNIPNIEFTTNAQSLDTDTQ